MIAVELRIGKGESAKSDEIANALGELTLCLLDEILAVVGKTGGDNGEVGVTLLDMTLDDLKARKSRRGS